MDERIGGNGANRQARAERSRRDAKDAKDAKKNPKSKTDWAVTVNEEAACATSDSRFLVIVLWLCAAAALWLFLSPAAFTRRALTRRANRLDAELRQAWILNVGLERWRNGLEGDASVIEREARKLGYGRPNERLYPLSDAELRAARARLNAEISGGETPWSSTLGRSLAPALLLFIAGIVAVLFFTDLKVDDPSADPKP